MEYSGSVFIIIHKWMMDVLGLRGYDLMIYAILYGFSRGTKSGEYYGSLDYLEQLSGATKRAVIYSLNELVNRSLIIKRVEIHDNKKCCIYTINDAYVPLNVEGDYLKNLVNAAKQMQKDSEGRCKNCTSEEEIGCKNFTQKDNTINTLNSNSSNSLDEETKDNSSIELEKKPKSKDTKEKKSIEKKKPKSQSNKPNCETHQAMVRERRLDPRLEDAILDWLDYKTQRGDTYVPLTITKMLNRLEKSVGQYGVGKVVRMLNDTMGDGYQGIGYFKLEKMAQEQPRRPQYQLLE